MDKPEITYWKWVERGFGDGGKQKWRTGESTCGSKI